MNATVGSDLAVSILVPTHNRPKLLRQCLQAIAKQTFANFEIIVINDAGARVESVVAEFPQLTLQLVDQPTNRGQVGSRNRGLDVARGEYIALCDDDDLWLPVHLMGLVQAADVGADLAYSDAEIVVLEQKGDTRTPQSRALFAFDFDTDLLRHWNFIPPSTALYRRGLHDRLGRFDESMGDYWDWDWWLRVAQHGLIVRVAMASTLIGIDAAGENASAIPERMALNLARLVTKHGLGQLPTSNFLRMIREPALAARRRQSQMIWDGAMPPGILHPQPSP